MTDPLASLTTSLPDLDRALLASTLAPYVQLDRDSGEVIPLNRWQDVPNEGRVLLYLLSLRAAVALGLRACIGATPVEIERATGVPGGSIRPALKRLLKARQVARLVGCGYLVPVSQLARVKRYVDGY